MSKKKIRKKRGGFRHFSRARKRERFFTSLGIKGKEAVLVDSTLTQRKRYIQEGQLYCCKEKRFLSLEECLKLQSEAVCKEANTACPNRVK